MQILLWVVSGTQLMPCLSVSVCRVAGFITELSWPGIFISLVDGAAGISFSLRAVALVHWYAYSQFINRPAKGTIWELCLGLSS